MSKIEISEIRKSADSLKELNEGYKLYQNQDFEEFEFEIVRIPTLSFVVSAIFHDERVTLTYGIGKEVKGDCFCNLKNGLCMHEICLFFCLRDKLNTLFKDKESEAQFYDSAKQDEFMQDLMEINIQRNVFEYIIRPILYFKEDKLCLKLEFNSRDSKQDITNLPAFINMLDKKGILTIGNKKFSIEYKYFDEESRQVIDMLYLTRNSLTLLNETSEENKGRLDLNVTAISTEILNSILIT